MTQTYDLLGIGNAIMDVIAPVGEDFLINHEIAKGGMMLIDEPRAQTLTDALADKGPVLIAGGSGANTVVGAQALGIKTAYIGVVADDELGRQFQTGLLEAKVNYTTPAQSSGLATARCLIAVTGDGQRSMSTFLGASTQFDAAQLDEALIRSAKVVYLEGYLFDSEPAKAAFIKAASLARAAGREVALTLSDQFCVDRYRAAFLDLVENHIDILFANEDEITALYEADFESASESIAQIGVLAALTRGEKGSVIISGSERHLIDSVAVDKVVDTTGAGDQYAAGFLSAYTRGESLDLCGAWGSACAAEVISHFGARPEREITL